MFGIRRKSSAGPKVFFATDLHGSTLAFRKVLATPRFYEVDAIVLGGDLTGKRLVEATTPEQEERAETEGAYVCSQNGSMRRSTIPADPDEAQQLFTALAQERLASWLTRAEEVLAETQTPCYMIGGNDDGSEILEVLASHRGSWVRYCEEQVVPLADEYYVVGFGWSNHTPWNTPRELPEDEIHQRLERAISASPDLSRTIVDVHVPPHGILDVCPKLDTSVSPPRTVIKAGQVVTTSVGSTAIRETLATSQPLLALCGHVHEARGVMSLGRTTVINPGSEYQDGILRGAVIRLDRDRAPRYQLTSG